MAATPLTVAWISDYPIEWMPDLPEPLRDLPRPHPATWMAVLLGEWEQDPALKLHVIVLRKTVAADCRFERNGVVFHVLKAPGGWRAPSLFWVDTVLIGRALKEIRPDLLHAWGTERGCALVASRLRVPYVVTMQGILTWYRQLVPLNAYERFAAVVERVSLRRARVATTESRFAVGYLRRTYRRLTVCQAEHAPNWVFHRVERRPQTSPIRFLAIGTIAQRKGTDLLLQALDQLVREIDFELILVGAPDRPWLEQVKSGLSPELWRRVHIQTGLLPAEVARHLATATVLVLPTRADTSPNAVKEAAVAGVPVVASRVGGIPDYVFPEENGLLFESGNLGQLVEALRAACRHPRFSRGAVEPAALERVRDYLSPARMGQNFLGAYRIALGRPG